MNLAEKNRKERFVFKTRTLKFIAGISAAIALLGVLFLVFTQPDRCPHYYRNSEPVCVFCGSSCSHDFEQGTCRVCGYTCLHTWENGLCSTCGMECGHSFEQEVCSLCGESCAHHWSDGACEICGLECGHQWKEGSCTVCSLNCSHRWQKGVCEICGVECMHPTHTKEENVFTAPVCTLCGEAAVHRWVYGQCTVCSASFQFVERQLPDSLVKENAAAGKGKVETVSYQSHYYGQNGAECTKRMTVYTPYGYSPEQEYDLMLFCVGSNGASTLYFSDPYTYFDAGEIPGAKNLFDNMIAANLCKPFIAVCIEYRSVSYTDDMAYWQDREQVKQELVQDILPYLIEHYSLYAKSTEREELIRNREHMAFFGSSYGGYICHTAGLMDSFELIGYFGTSSGGWVYNAISSGADASDLPLYYFYASGGSPYLDEYYDGSTGDYSCFLRRSGKLIDGVNGHSGLIEGGNHKAGTWVTALFNFARLSFHGDP